MTTNSTSSQFWDCLRLATDDTGCIPNHSKTQKNVLPLRALHREFARTAGSTHPRIAACSLESGDKQALQGMADPALFVAQQRVRESPGYAAGVVHMGV